MFTVNFGSGTEEEAAAWVKHTNMVLCDDVSGDDFEAERLARKTRGTSDDDDALHLFRIVDGPFHRLESAHGSADDAVEFLDAETVGKFFLGVYHVPYRDGTQQKIVNIR